MRAPIPASILALLNIVNYNITVNTTIVQVSLDSSVT
jgi:hypothetical protein